MLRAQRVILDGFKSYANRTVVDNFDQEFNAITGLNGSGESARPPAHTLAATDDTRGQFISNFNFKKENEILCGVACCWVGSTPQHTRPCSAHPPRPRCAQPAGKSNILDAICFVLGITNLTQVRAKNLQDLVYKNGQAGVTKVRYTWPGLSRDHSPCPTLGTCPIPHGHVVLMTRTSCCCCSRLVRGVVMACLESSRWLSLVPRPLSLCVECMCARSCARIPTLALTTMGSHLNPPVSRALS
jgi:hypothetical protein